jgi:hypothetical protein
VETILRRQSGFGDRRIADNPRALVADAADQG